MIRMMVEGPDYIMTKDFRDPFVHEMGFDLRHMEKFCDILKVF